MAALPVQFDRRPIVVVMGVSGSGKSTVGIALANKLGLPFLDADDYHPASNVDKMSRGIPLNDEDRWPWLKSLSRAMASAAQGKGGVVATCSALKRSYRDLIQQQVGKPLVFMLLDGKRELLLARMQQRNEHYMPPSLLDSQLATLERPEEDEPVSVLSIDQSIDQLLDEMVTHLAHPQAT